MSVYYVLLYCLLWVREREEELGEIGMVKDLKMVLRIKYGATAVIRLILKTGLLEQFKVTV
jgi:hypothetical protein